MWTSPPDTETLTKVSLTMKTVKKATSVSVERCDITR